jgi:hypothetical protein
MNKNFCYAQNSQLSTAVCYEEKSYIKLATGHPGLPSGISSLQAQTDPPGIDAISLCLFVNDDGEKKARVFLPHYGLSLSEWSTLQLHRGGPL